MNTLEQVLAVPSSQVAKLIPMGLVKVNEAEMLDFVAREGRFLDRTPQLEQDTQWRQIIPYVLVSHTGKLLMYQRAKASMDKRLHAKFSLGFGGHTNTQDSQAGINPIICGRTRELSEELQLSQAPNFEFLGTLNISQTPIDQFHLGFVYKANATSPEYAINEPESFTWSGWSSLGEIAEKFDFLESWSQKVFSTLFPHLIVLRTTV